MVDRRRKWRAENEDIYIQDSLGKNTYIVRGSRGKDYTVELDTPSCSCPDWKKRSPDGGCKHIIKVKLENGIIDPLISSRTDFGSPQERSNSDYDHAWAELSTRTKRRDNYTCQNCGGYGGPYGNATLNAHHIRPKSKGGVDRLDNLITLCNDCHEKEHGHTIPSKGLGNSSAGVSGSGSSNQKVQNEKELDYPADSGGENNSDVDKTVSSSNNSTNEMHHSRSNKSDVVPKEESGTSDVVSTEETENTPTATEQEESFGLMAGVITYIFITLILTLILPPFFEITDWKVGVGMILVGLLYIPGLLSNLSQCDLLRLIRDVIGLGLFSWGAIIYLIL